MNAKDKEQFIHIIKSVGKKPKQKLTTEDTFKINGVSSQYFAETEVLAKSYSNSKSLEVRKSLRTIVDSE